MGLKTTNYEVKSMKETLDTAYAYIRKIIVDEHGDGYAYIAVHRTRELAQDPTVKPYELKEIKFKCVRTVNDRVTAYQVSKEKIVLNKWNKDTHKLEKVEEDGPFTGWDDDVNY